MLVKSASTGELDWMWKLLSLGIDKLELFVVPLSRFTYIDAISHGVLLKMSLNF